MTTPSQLLVVDTSVALLDPELRPRQANAAHPYRELLDGSTTGLPLAVVAELLQGVRISQRQRGYGAVVDAYVERKEILLPNRITAILWAEIRVACRRQGIAASENDAWIAAAALELGQPLVSDDRDHLRMSIAVPGLRVLSLLPPPQ